MRYDLDPNCPTLHLYVLAKCKTVRLLDGDTLFGKRRFDEQSAVVAPLGLPRVGARSGSRISKLSESARGLIDDFLRTDPEKPGEILRFTKRHGVLEHTPRDEYFSLNLRRWRELKGLFNQWFFTHLFLKDGPFPHNPKSYRPIPLCDGESFEVRPEGLYLHTVSLFNLMLLVLVSLPRTHLRVCAMRDCRMTFISGDLKQKYCGPACSRQGQLLSKRNCYYKSRG